MFKLKKTRIITYILLFSSILYHAGIKGSDDAIDCSSSFSVINEKKTLSLSVTFSAYNGNGLITFTGGSDGIGDNISIRKYFSYEKNRNGIYVFKNKDSEIRLPPHSDNATVGTFLPGFFTDTHKEDEFIVKIMPIKKSAWLFMSTNTPYFICENTASDRW